MSDLETLIQVIDEAGFLIKTQKEFIEHLLGKRESFGNNDTVGFGVRVDEWLKQWELSHDS